MCLQYYNFATCAFFDSFHVDYGGLEHEIASVRLTKSSYNNQIKIGMRNIKFHV